MTDHTEFFKETRIIQEALLRREHPDGVPEVSIEEAILGCCDHMDEIQAEWMDKDPLMTERLLYAFASLSISCGKGMRACLNACQDHPQENRFRIGIPEQEGWAQTVFPPDGGPHAGTRRS